MRTLFLILVLANLAFFVWSRHFSPSEAAADGVVAHRNEPDKLKIVPPSEAGPAPLTQKAPPAPLAASGCLEWGSFTLMDYPRAEKALEPLALGARLGQRRTEETAGWWVFIPPQGSRQAALKKAAELKAFGVEDYYVVADESDARWALSLGIYRTEEAAHARLQGLRAQGVRSAMVGLRETVLPKVWLQVKGVDTQLEARLKDIAREIEGTVLRPCF
jgi:hypothetical protein